MEGGNAQLDFEKSLLKLLAWGDKSYFQDNENENREWIIKRVMAFNG